MTTERGMAPRNHFVTRTTTEKLGEVLDRAELHSVEVLVIAHTGGRDWVVVTRGNPIPGPAGSRVFHQREE
jgi:hypothetical protein